MPAPTSSKRWLAETANYLGAESKPQSFEIAQAQNGFVTHYDRNDWTYGDAASKETLPTVNFGIPTVSYFTDEARTQPYTGDFNQYTPAGTYYVTVRVEGTNNYTEIVDETHSFTVNQATNAFVGSYERDGWTYGDAASAETLPTANFGSVTVTYYTNAECTEPYLGTFGMSTAAGTYYAKVTVAETNNYTALEEVKSFTVAKATAQAVWSAGDLTYNSTDKANVITATFYEKVSGSYVELQVTVTEGQMGKRRGLQPYGSASRRTRKQLYADQCRSKLHRSQGNGNGNAPCSKRTIHGTNPDGRPARIQHKRQYLRARLGHNAQHSARQRKRRQLRHNCNAYQRQLQRELRFRQV